MSAGDVVALLFVIALVLAVYACGWLDGREEQRQQVRHQMQALRATLRLSEEAWQARQEMHDAAAEARRRQGIDTGDRER